MGYKKFSYVLPQFYSNFFQKLMRVGLSAKFSNYTSRGFKKKNEEFLKISKIHSDI